MDVTEVATGCKGHSWGGLGTVSVLSHMHKPLPIWKSSNTMAIVAQLLSVRLAKLK